MRPPRVRRPPQPPPPPPRAPRAPDPTAPLAPQLAALAADPYYCGLVGGPGAGVPGVVGAGHEPSVPHTTAPAPALLVAPRGGTPWAAPPAAQAAAQAVAAAAVAGGLRVVHVNPKQFHRILVRRAARARAATAARATAGVRLPYAHESRHAHAVRRPRGPGGKFLSRDKTRGGGARGGGAPSSA